MAVSLESNLFALNHIEASVPSSSAQSHCSTSISSIEAFNNGHTLQFVTAARVLCAREDLDLEARAHGCVLRAHSRVLGAHGRALYTHRDRLPM